MSVRYGERQWIEAAREREREREREIGMFGEQER